MSEPAVSEWVQVIHPETGGTAEVNRSSLTQLYASGWRLLAPDEVPDPEPEPVPPPMTRAEATEPENEEN